MTDDELAIDQAISIRVVDHADAIVSLQVPYDRIRRPGAVPEFDCIACEWSIAKRNKNSGAVIAGNRSFLIAVCVAIFYRYTGQLDIPLTVNLPGRAQSVKNLLLQARISGDTRFSVLEYTIRQTLAGAQDSGHRSGPVAVTISDGGVVTRREQNLVQHAPSASDIEQELPDLHFMFNQGLDTVKLDVVFDTCVFDRETIARLANNLRQVVSTVTLHPDTQIASLDLPAPVERERLGEFCSGQSLKFTTLPATREFEEWANERGSNVAIEFNDIRMTYSEANARANRIAWFLLASEIASGDHVIVCLHPCPDLPLVLLALLKIGAVYVPVNPEYPQARIDAIADDTQPVLVISQKLVTDKIHFSGRGVVDIANIDDRIAGLPVDNPTRSVEMEQIAYIYYTSGTTGRPKGVTGSHSNLIQMLHSSRLRYDISEADTIPAVASFTFSISMFELLSPLTAGGTLLLLERKRILNAEEMAKILRSVTFFHIGPSLLKGIIKHIKHNVADWSVYSRVRHASSGGDMVPPEVLNDLRAIFSAAEIFVIYGCSEVSLMGCTYEMREESIERTYVGKPLGNVQLLVLDDDGNQVPIGAVGDVCFGGPGVVPGYLNRPELTEKQFFLRNGVRYYRTGDRGRLTTAGLLELLGRRDFQVQVRGMRVEIGDIEYHLRRVPGVRDGVVSMKKSRSGDARLMAYFVPDVAQNVDGETIRQHLLSQMPEFMVPVRYLQLSALPLNQNLKIDRNALPDEAPIASGSIINRNAPVSETEIVLGQIWQGLLGVEFVGLDDNFLLLGGDSILAMEMIFLVHQRLGVRLDGMDVLRESLQVLAAICDQARAHEHTKSLETVRRPLLRNIASQESFYFGTDDSLYGVYNPPLGTEASTPVLICGPCGHENSRCAFFMKQLAAAFAVRGVPVLRFNYFGCEDSSGDSSEATLQRWHEDIRSAANWLRRKTGSRTTNVLGVRLGAILAAQALAGDSEQRLFAWDPLVDVNSHIVEQRRMHLEKVEKLLVIRRLRRPASIAGIEELLGFCYSAAMIRDLSQLAWCREFTWPTVTVLSSPQEGQRTRTALAVAQDVGEEVVRLPVDCGWYDSTRVTAAITSVLISNALLEAIAVYDSN